MCRKFCTAAEFAAENSEWTHLLQLDCLYTMFLASDTTFSDPIFLGNKFWPGAPNLECMFDYDVVRHRLQAWNVLHHVLLSGAVPELAR